MPQASSRPPVTLTTRRVNPTAWLRFLANDRIASIPLVIRNLAWQDSAPLVNRSFACHHPLHRTQNPSCKSGRHFMDAPLAIVLAAGKGTRMKSDLPKVMCQVNGRAMVQFVLDALEDAGVQR